MLEIPIQTGLSAWRDQNDLFRGVPETDAQLLATLVQHSDVQIASFPPRCHRSLDQNQRVEKLRDDCRSLRRQFLALHADWLYRVLTRDFTAHKGLSELAYSAAEFCPGLVPSPAQIADERTRPQSEKEGYEIDQGVFFHTLLRSPRIGAHIVESALRPTERAQALLSAFRSSASLDLGTVLIERRETAAHLTINNGYCLNAEDDRLIDDMETAIDLTLLDDEVRVGVLRGGIMTHPRYAGRRVFSAGINLKALHAGQISFVDFLLRRELGYINKMIRGLHLKTEAVSANNWNRPWKRLGKPWIAAVDTFAIGGGTQLLLVCDRVIAAADSYIRLPAAQEGIVPGLANLRLTRILGGRIARQVILFGRQIWAQEPNARLLVDEVVDSTEIERSIDISVQQLGGPAVAANRHMLHLAEEPLETFLQYVSEFALVQAERLYSPDVLAKIDKFSRG
jgi:thioesterase DpgC